MSYNFIMKSQLFISHAWGKDTLGRDNHIRCKEIYSRLIRSGYNAWFDEYDLYGNIDSSIIKGINNSYIILICLTQKYCEKVNNAIETQIPNDNCFKEWNYSLFKNKIIIPIIMEPIMKDIFLNGDGVIQMYLNSTMFIDMTENINGNAHTDLNYKLLCRTLHMHGVYNNKPPNKLRIINYSLSNYVPYINTLKKIKRIKYNQAQKSSYKNILTSRKNASQKNIITNNSKYDTKSNNHPDISHIYSVKDNKTIIRI